MTDQIHVINELNQAVTAFKAELAQRDEALKKGVIDTLREGAIHNLENRISELQGSVDTANLALASMRLDGNSQAVADAPYSAAFSAHVRAGDISNDLRRGDDGNGGFLAPTEWDRSLEQRLLVLSPLRAICQVQSTSKNAFTKLFGEPALNAGWVGETDARNTTPSATFKQLTYATGEIYVNPCATQQLLDDAEVNLEAWLLNEIDAEIAAKENQAFVNGTGTNQPKGLLQYISTSDHPWGKIAEVKSGAAATITADALIDLVYSLPAAYAQNAKFIMNRKTLGAIRKLKDAQGNYLWQPSFAPGQPSTLLGFPVVEVAEMPDIAANKHAVLFGDFAQGYLILDRKGISVLRDPYTRKPYVHFYTTKRVGGGLLNPDCLRALKIAA